MANDMPCKDCKDRYIGCHDRCEKYQQFKKRNDEIREKERREKLINFEYWATTKIHKNKRQK